jgi:hypothetical protein
VRSFFCTEKPISDARLCQYAAGLFRPGFNLLAEVPDVYAESLNVGLGAFPGLGQKMPVREHFSLVQHQFVEQAIFAWSQLGIYTAYPHQTTRKIDAEVAIVVDGGTALHLYTMTQGCPHARHKLGDAEWLWDKVIGSGIKRRNLARLVVESGKNNYGRGACRVHWADQVYAVAVWQSKIEDSEIELAPRDNALRARHIGRLFNIEAFGNQRGPKETPDGRLIIDDDRLKPLA